MLSIVLLLLETLSWGWDVAQEYLPSILEAATPHWVGVAVPTSHLGTPVEKGGAETQGYP